MYVILKKTLEDKNHIFPFPDENETNIQISEIRDNLISKFETTIFRKWLPRDFSRFIDFSKKIHYRDNGYFTVSGIFGGDNSLNDSLKNCIGIVIDVLIICFHIKVIFLNY